MTEINESFQRALDFVQYTNCSVFLTGKAGTGKTTFLQHIKKANFKKTVVVAPTGVAAIHAGGSTIHSFFQLPFSGFIPEVQKFTSTSSLIVKDKDALLSKLRISSERREVMQQMELLIIDEVSMVRCDLLDAMDTVLRHIRNNQLEAFGGVQMLFIGDLYQLPPVIKDEEWGILRSYYSSPFFFDSRVMRNNPPLYLSLEKVYRQKDTDFLNLLNKVRNNRMNEVDFIQLNQHYLPDFIPEIEESYITLTTHNYKADAINEKEISKLYTPEVSFEAIIEGEFYENSYPADKVLRIKPGAQVMFIKNDTEKIRRYFNGKIGTVQQINAETITVSCKGEDESIEVGREVWKNIRYKVNPQTGKMEEEEIGSFSQYPLRLAWAITIHKSQGLTFEKAVIDAGDAFAPGQVYVALSRCTSMKGMVLKSRIHEKSIKNDERIDAFARTQLNITDQQNLLGKSKINYRHQEILHLFDEGKIMNGIKELIDFLRKEQASFINGSLNNIEEIQKAIQAIEETSGKFRQQINPMLQNDLAEFINETLQQRLIASFTYFGNAWKNIKKLVEDNHIETDNRLMAAEFSKKINRIYLDICLKIHFLEGHENGFNIGNQLALKQCFIKPETKIQVYSGSKTNTQNNETHYLLYELLKQKRDEICEKVQLPVYIVASTQSLKEMCLYLPKTPGDLERISGFGKIKIRQYGEDFLFIIREYCETYGYASNMQEKEIKKNKKGNKATADYTTKVEHQKKQKPDTKKISLELHKEGKSIAEIALSRQLAQSTIEGHLSYYVGSGEIKLEEFVSSDKIEKIREAINQFGKDQLSVLKAQLPAEVSYGEIRMVVTYELAKKSL